MSTNDIEDIRQQLDRIEAMTSIGVKPILTLEEAAIFTGYKTSGLYQLTSKKQIPHCKKNGRIYFEKQKLIAWMTESPVLTEAELNSRAETYTAINQRQRI